MCRSEERRVGKSVDLCVTGVQTCALPIYEDDVLYVMPLSFAQAALGDSVEVPTLELDEGGEHVQIGRASCGKECRSLCDWSSDVCSSDLRRRRAVRNAAFVCPGRPGRLGGSADAGTGRRRRACADRKSVVWERV